MLLNRVEYALMNNPLRAAIQRRFEAPRLLRMGGSMSGGRALEIGCGRGVGTELILDRFGAGRVDAFDLDPRMVAEARARLHRRGARVRLWVGDAGAIAAPGSAYEAVFDFGIVHHVPDWRRVLAEVHRVLVPGGCFYAEEVLEPFLAHPVTRRLLEHPEHDRFDRAGFVEGLQGAGLVPLASEELWRAFAWFVARKPAGEGSPRRG
jgi:ubiquinone/menaquinone biosynthesis C-methylase UbiE